MARGKKAFQEEKEMEEREKSPVNREVLEVVPPETTDQEKPAGETAKRKTQTQGTKPSRKKTQTVRTVRKDDPNPGTPEKQQKIERKEKKEDTAPSAAGKKEQFIPIGREMPVWYY